MIKNRDIYILMAITALTLFISLTMWKTDTNLLVSYQSQTLMKDVSVQFDNIQTIEISKDGKDVVYENIEGIWSQTSPFEMRMDAVSMLALVETVQGLIVLGELLDPTSSMSLGLGEDATTVSLFDGDASVTIRLGRKTLGGRAYAQRGTEDPVLVDQSLHRRVIDMDHREWRDIRLFPDFAIDGVRIERHVVNDRLLLERKGGDWTMREPVSARVDQEMMLEWIGKLAAARIGSFVMDNPHDLGVFGLDNPSATFETTDIKGNSHELWIGDRASAGSQDRYVLVDGQPVVYKMRWEGLSQLFPIPEMFVDATASGISRFDVKRFTIRSGRMSIQLHRELDRWLDGDGVLVDYDAVNRLLQWVLDTKSTSVALNPYPRELEVATIVFEGYDLAPLDTVRIARNEQGQWMLENGDHVLRLHPTESGGVLEQFINFPPQN